MHRHVASSVNINRRSAKVQKIGMGAEVDVRLRPNHIGVGYRIDYEVLKLPSRVADMAFPARKNPFFFGRCPLDS